MSAADKKKRTKAKKRMILVPSSFVRRSEQQKKKKKTPKAQKTFVRYNILSSLKEGTKHQRRRVCSSCFERKRSQQVMVESRG